MKIEHTDKQTNKPPPKPLFNFEQERHHMHWRLNQLQTIPSLHDPQFSWPNYCLYSLFTKIPLLEELYVHGPLQFLPYRYTSAFKCLPLLVFYEEE